MNYSVKFSLVLILLLIFPYSCSKTKDTGPKPDPKLSGIDPFEELELFELNDSTIKAKLVTAREGKLDMFSCTDCHDSPKKSWSLEALKEDGTHDEILEVYKHANKSVMDCMTCHSLNDRDHLKMLSGKKITFDESFMLCGQCHSGKLKDWKNGAHGKRVGKWEGDGVYQNCADCHNPHFPASAYPKRKPVVDATLIRKELEAYNKKKSHGKETEKSTVFDVAVSYKKKCASCHGVDGSSEKKSSKINELSEKSDEELFDIIKNGKKTGKIKMPAFAKKFSDEEIKQIVQHVKGFDKSGE